MRVTVEHLEKPRGILGIHRAFYLDCFVELTEEERAIIGARDLEHHTIPLPKGFVAVPNPDDIRRHYALKVAIAAAAALFGLVFSVVTGGTVVYFGLLFFAGCGYAIYCAVRIVFPPDIELERLPLSLLLERRHFSIRSNSPSRSKDIEVALTKALESAKLFIDDSAELGGRRTIEI
jgi:hypothetical protein